MVIATFTPVDEFAIGGIIAGKVVTKLGPIVCKNGKRVYEWVKGIKNATNKTTTSLSTYRKTTAGETFQHYGYKEQATNFQNGLRPGGFATTADGLTGASAKSGLSLPHATPPNAVYTVTPKPGTVVRVNPVAEPKFGQPGGLPEFQFPSGTGPGTVSGPRTLP